MSFVCLLRSACWFNVVKNYDVNVTDLRAKSSNRVTTAAKFAQRLMRPSNNTKKYQENIHKAMDLILAVEWNSSIRTI